jgi:glycosyltransferase involved in cell wall biosynthesis
MQSELLPKLIRITTVAQSLRGLLRGQLRFMSDYFEIVGISSSGKDLERVREEEGVRVVPIEMARQINPIRDVIALWRLYRVFRKEKPLIVHTHTPKAGTVGMLAAWLARVPYRLHTIAGLPLVEARGMKRILLNQVEKITYGCATHIYPISYGLVDIILKEKFCSQQKLKVIAKGSSNGINTSFFNPLLFSSLEKQELRKELNISIDDFVFIFVGRLVSDKGINELVEAFDKISNVHGHVKLLLVGAEEPDLDPLKKETLQRIKTNNNIIPVGYQQDVRPYFSVSDALTFPSYREGFGNVVAQAGAMGLPSIVTDISGCNEIIIEGKNGTIIPAKDAMALRKKMELFITDRALVGKLRSKAREMIISRYEQKMVWEALLEEYKSLAGKY